MQDNDVSKSVLKLYIAEKVINVDIRMFEINETNLSQELARQAAQYAWLATLAVEAESDMVRKAAMREREYANIDLDFRDEMRASGEKCTEGMIRAVVTTDEDYMAAVEAENAAKYQYQLLKMLVRAMEQRANMLISLGAYLRHEESMTGMKIRERAMRIAVDEAKSSIRNRRKSQE